MWVDFKDSVGESWGQSLGFCRVTPEKGGAPSHGSYSPRQHRTPNTTHTASGVTCALGLTDPGAGLPPGGLEFLGPPSVLLILGCLTKNLWVQPSVTTSRVTLRALDKGLGAPTYPLPGLRNKAELPCCRL